MSHHKSHHKNGYGFTAGKRNHGERDNQTLKSEDSIPTNVSTETFFNKVVKGQIVKIGGTNVQATVSDVNKSYNTLVVTANLSLKEFNKGAPKVSLPCGASAKSFQAVTHPNENKLTLTFVG